MTQINSLDKNVTLLGVEITNISLSNCLKQIVELVEARALSFIVTPNVDHIIKLQKDLEFRQIYEHADLVLADGVPLLWAARFLCTPLKEKISGSDLFPKVCKLAAEKNFKLFFLGGRPEAAEKAAQLMRKRHPGIQITGTYCPPYNFENDPIENIKIINLIRQAKPDILFVGLGAPKQEKWIFIHRNQHQAPLSLGIGVSFEFVTGMVKRAPLWMQKVGLEWFWRLMMEPNRLWKRYLIDDIQFFWLILKQKMTLRKNSKEYI